MKIPVSDIQPNPRQPRRDFDPVKLEELADSLSQNGQVQAITVEELTEGGYQIIAGERRWRAACLLNWIEIEATVLPPFSGNGQADRQRLQMALVENVHRHDMNPIEIGQAYQDLRDAGSTDSQIATMVGKSQSNVWLYRALLKFPDEVVEQFRAGNLPVDQGLVHVMRKLTPEQLVKTVPRLAAKKVSGSTIIKACKKFIDSDFIGGREKQPPVLIKGSSVPSVRLGAKGGFAWNRAFQAAEETCRTCDWFDSATDEICKVCPAVTMVTLMTK